MALYDFLLYRPIFNLLVFFYDAIPGNDIGLAIILVTVAIKFLLLPLSKKALVNQKALQQLQPKLEALKEKYKNEKEKMAQATMQLYKEEKINPLSSCLPLLIQLPIIIAVYNVFRIGLSTQDFSALYTFVPNPGTINTLSFGFVDMAASATLPGLILAVAAGLAQYFQARMFSRRQPPKDPKGHLVKGSEDESVAAIMNKQMLYLMPALTVIFGYYLPAGLVLYWLVQTLFMLIQQILFFRKDELKG